VTETSTEKSDRELAENGAASIMTRPEVLDYVCDYIRKGHMETFVLSQPGDATVREAVYYAVNAVDSFKNTMISLSASSIRRRGTAT